jgi:hypothetical protein
MILMIRGKHFHFCDLCNDRNKSFIRRNYSTKLVVEVTVDKRISLVEFPSVYHLEMDYTNRKVITGSCIINYKQRREKCSETRQ